MDLSHVTPATPLGMYYHTFNVQTFGFEIGLATSRDGGKSWQKQGPCKMTRGAPGSHRWVDWSRQGVGKNSGPGNVVSCSHTKTTTTPPNTNTHDRDLGHATRCVIKDPAGRKKLLMFAECANTQNSNCIAVYGSDNGLTWEDMHAADAPAYRGAGLGTGRWDAQALGCPSVIVRDGRFYMYYVGAFFGGGAWVFFWAVRFATLSPHLSFVCLPPRPTRHRLHRVELRGRGAGVHRAGGQRRLRLHQVEAHGGVNE